MIDLYYWTTPNGHLEEAAIPYWELPQLLASIGVKRFELAGQPSRED